MLTLDDIFILPRVILNLAQLLFKVGLASPMQLYAIIFLGFGFLIFFLLIAPIPFISRMGQAISRALGFPLIGGASAIFVIGAGALMILALETSEYYFLFRSGAQCGELATEAMQKDCRVKRLQRERNMWLNTAVSALWLSLWKISGMLRDKQKKD